MLSAVGSTYNATGWRCSLEETGATAGWKQFVLVSCLVTNLHWWTVLQVGLHPAEASSSRAELAINLQQGALGFAAALALNAMSA